MRYRIVHTYELAPRQRARHQDTNVLHDSGHEGRRISVGALREGTRGACASLRLPSPRQAQVALLLIQAGRQPLKLISMIKATCAQVAALWRSSAVRGSVPRGRTLSSKPTVGVAHAPVPGARHLWDSYARILPVYEPSSTVRSSWCDIQCGMPRSTCAWLMHHACLHDAFALQPQKHHQAH